LNTYRTQLQVTTPLSLIYTLCSSLQHVLSLLRPLCLHQSLPYVGSQQCPLLPCSRSHRPATDSQLTHCSSCLAYIGTLNLLLFICCLAKHAENIIPLLLFAGRCLATTAVQSSISRSSPSNGSTCHNIIIAFGIDSRPNLSIYVVVTMTSNQVYYYYYYYYYYWWGGTESLGIFSSR
jgi:hypothetical protein